MTTYIVSILPITLYNIIIVIILNMLKHYRINYTKHVESYYSKYTFFFLITKYHVNLPMFFVFFSRRFPDSPGRGPGAGHHPGLARGRGRVGAAVPPTRCPDGARDGIPQKLGKSYDGTSWEIRQKNW